MDIANYIRHKLYAPDVFHRRFDIDLEILPDRIKRVALAALPFIGLYQPAGVILSLGMNGIRTFSHLQTAFEHQAAPGGRTKWICCAFEVGKAAIAVIALLSLFFSSTIALCITNGYDAVHGLYSTCQALCTGEWSKAAEEAGETLVSSLYLAFILSGHLELMLAFSLFNVLLSTGHAVKEFKNGKIIEGFAKLGFAAVRGFNCQQYLKQIQRRNELLRMQKVRSLFEKIFRGREASHLISHPLSSLQELIDTKDVILKDGDGNNVHFGAHIHGIGQSLVKGENLTLRTLFVDGIEMVEIDFKVNHAFRASLDQAIQDLNSFSPKEMREILTLSGSHVKAITVETGKEGFFPQLWEENIDSAVKIQMQELGTVLIGSLPEIPNLYDRVVIRLDANKTLFELHEILCLLNLDQSLRLSCVEDIERLKIGQLFRIFCPREATLFERTEEFFTLPIAQLRAKISEIVPEMSEIFTLYLSQMTQAQIFDGRVRYKIEGLADAAYTAGARGLTAAITGAHTDEEIFRRTLSILRMGIISTETRYENGFNQHGLGGWGVDFFSGGADSVYTQLLTKTTSQQQVPFNTFVYESKVRLLIDLKALELGTYQYHYDSLGNRMVDSSKEFWFLENYSNRDGILEFIRKEVDTPWWNGSNEVMFKERLDPSYISRLIVHDEATKINLLAYLREHDLDLRDDFIRIENHVSEALFI